MKNFGEQMPSKESHSAPQKLIDAVPFINLPVSEEEKEHNAQLKKATDLLTSGKMDEALVLMETLRNTKKPKEAWKEFELTAEKEKAFNDARAKIAEQLGYIVETNEEKFLTLKKDGYTIAMKHFMFPSFAGVNGGRISEIAIGKGGKWDEWDNGWYDNKEPEDAGTKKIFDELVNYLS